MIESKKDVDENKNDGNKNNNGIVKKEKDQEPPIVTLKSCRGISKM